jgi:hypothetical protein
MHRMRAARFAVFSAIRYSAYAAAIEGAHPTDPLVFAAAENQR